MFKSDDLFTNIHVACLEWVGCGSGMGAGWEGGRAHPFETTGGGGLSRKGALRAGSSINAPIRDNRGGGGA